MTAALLLIITRRPLLRSYQRALCGQVDVWDHERSEPVASFAWGADTVTAVRFNPADSELLASAASDRAVALYDLRNAAPVRKLVMQARRPRRGRPAEPRAWWLSPVVVFDASCDANFTCCRMCQTYKATEALQAVAAKGRCWAV